MNVFLEAKFPLEVRKCLLYYCLQYIDTILLTLGAVVAGTLKKPPLTTFIVKQNRAYLETKLFHIFTIMKVIIT